MPIDPMILNAMIDPFRNMVEDCKQKNITGDDFNTMCATLTRMEQLGQEHSDLNAFNGQMAQENLFGKFSEFYSRALSAQAKQEYASGEKSFDDASLLKTSIDALKQAIVTLRQNYEDTIRLAKGEDAEEQMNKSLDFIERNSEKGKFSATGGMGALRKEAKKSFDKTMKDTPNAYDNSVEVEIMQNPDELIKPIQDVIDLGEQPGMTLPRFLKLQMERGLDKAMEGAVVARKGLVTDLEFTSVNPVSPHYLDRCNKKIACFDELASKHKFKVPNWKEFNLNRDDIDREFAPKIEEWDTIRDFWDKMLWDLSFWSLSYCSFAPYIEPWSMSDNPKEATIRTQNITPGVFKQRERLFQKYFGLSFHDIFKHPTFEWDVKYNYIDYSQIYTEFLIEKIYPACNPFNHLSSDIIDERASYYKKDRNAVDREMNPERHMPAERMRIFYNQKFGEGRHESKYGPVTRNESAAAPWSWDSFRYK